MTEKEKEGVAVFFDGASRHKKGGWGFVVIEIQAGRECGEPKRFHGAVPDDATNNDAEYCALEESLLYLMKNVTGGLVNVFGDSQLIVCQMTGSYKVKNPRLRERNKRCMRIIEELEKKGVAVCIKYIPRSANREADCESKLGLEIAYCIGSDL